jgi:hypothetical protein
MPAATPKKPAAPAPPSLGPPQTNLSIRAQLEAGPRFEPEVPDRDGARCICGDGTGPRDRLTGLCVWCWRSLRFAAFPLRPPCGCAECKET